MKKTAVLTSLLFLLSFWLVLAQGEKKPPAKLVFQAKMGNVTFDHAAHAKREKEDCKVCHDKLFPQAQEPIKFKDKMHKTAEAAKSSCAACHIAGGKSFETKGNCKKCHVKA
jgi:c(7)-type cytochrome triheme protein